MNINNDKYIDGQTLAVKITIKKRFDKKKVYCNDKNINAVK